VTPRVGESHEDFKAREAAYKRDRRKRLFQTMRATYDGDGVLQSQVTVPEREQYEPLAAGVLKRRSTLVDAEGNVIQAWHIESPEDKARQVAFDEALAAMRETLPRYDAIPAPSGASSDYLNVLPIGDHHMGMLSWKYETGESYDLDIGERLLAQATDHLLGRLRPAARCLIAVLGDYFHYDSMIPATPNHGNVLDADGRAQKMIRAGHRTLRRMIDQAAEIHEFVHVIVESGNHDPFSSVWLQELLLTAYENTPRITVDGSPSNFHYYRFGNNLIGTHHGDKRIKPDSLGAIMAVDRRQDWGETTHQYIYTGHVHSRNAFDAHGVSVESFRILPPGDAWAHQQGYRPIRDMKAIEIHVKNGEVGRYTFTPGMLEE
jgi:hypothetical protein